MASTDDAPSSTVTYEYDAFGNKNKAITSTSDTPSRTTETVFPNGRYQSLSKNAYDQVTSQVMARNALGQPTQVKSINGLIARTAYSDMGQKYLEYSPTGAYTISLMAEAGEHCPSQAAFQSRQLSAGGGEAVECFDKLGRSVRKATKLFDEQGEFWSYTDTEYDALSRVSRQSQPQPGYPWAVDYVPIWSIGSRGQDHPAWWSGPR